MAAPRAGADLYPVALLTDEGFEAAREWGPDPYARTGDPAPPVESPMVLDSIWRSISTCHVSAGLIVDTPVWVDFFAGETIPLLEDALALGTVVLAPVVVAELVGGVGEGPDRDALVELLEDLPLHETPRDHWARVGALRRRLGEGGDEARADHRGPPGFGSAVSWRRPDE